MPRFVILEHTVPDRPTHWDFMLEREGALQTWALEIEPAAGVPIPARQLADHRMAYLTYEGPISNNRGSVKQWDAGEFEALEDTTPGVKIVVRGSRLAGRVVIEPDADDDQRWIFRFSA